jgi:hypothetical protein
MTGFIRCSSALGLSALILMGTLSPVSAVADTSTPPATPSSSAPAPAPAPGTQYRKDAERYSLSVTPTRLVVGPTDVETTQKLTVVNHGEVPLAVTMEKRNFTTKADGSLDYQVDAPYAAADWLKVSPKQFEVQPGTSQVVTADIVMPDKPDLGDHQVALVFMVPAGVTKQNIKINRGIGAPVYITVPGATSDTTSISDFRGPKFAAWGPVDLTASVHNTGTVHRDFRGPGALQVHSSEPDTAFPDFTVPRDSVRDIATSWKPPLVCICHPTVSIDNTGAARQTETIRVIVFPWPILAGALAAALLIFFLVRLSRRRYRANVLRAAAAMQPPVSGGDV